MRNLINDIGIRLKTFSVCVQIRRVKDGIIDLNSDCLVFNEWEDYEKVIENMKETTLKFKNLINTYDDVNISLDKKIA